MSKGPQSPDWMIEAEVARRYGVCLRTMQRHRKAYDLPHKKFGRHVCYRVDDLPVIEATFDPAARMRAALAKRHK